MYKAQLKSILMEIEWIYVHISEAVRVSDLSDLLRDFLNSTTKSANKTFLNLFYVSGEQAFLNINSPLLRTHL